MSKLDRGWLSLMESMIQVENYNRTFPNYPVTVEDKGWIYGVWYCGTSWTKVVLHGQYPPSFLKRALSLFPEAESILHAPSGTLNGVPGVTLDMVSDDVRDPKILGDCGNLPFADIISDPPYTQQDSEIYGCPKFPMKRFVKEAHRVLSPGGCLGMLHTFYPSYHRKDFRLVALIGVITGFYRATRVFSILEKRGEKLQGEMFA